MHFLRTRPNNGAVDFPPASYCSVILVVWPVARDYAPATAICPYGEIQFHQTINSVDPFVIPRVYLPPQNLKKFWKTVSWVSLGHCLQRHNNGFVTRGIRTVMVNRSAQVQTPVGLTGKKSKCRYQMSDQLTLKA